MWEWRCWSPLTASPPADITALLGGEIEVEQAEERHYDVGDAAVDLRRVVMRRQKHAHEWSEGGGRSKSEAMMMLRIRRPGHPARCLSSSVECWVLKPKLALVDPVGVPVLPPAADQDDAPPPPPPLSDVRTARWLERHAQGCEPRVAKLLRAAAAATGADAPKSVVLRRRTLTAALPPSEHDGVGTSHLLLEQSDLEAAGRMWRCVCVKGSSPEQVQRYVLTLREHLIASGLVASSPGFVKMLLALPTARAPGDTAGGAPPSDGGIAADAYAADADADADADAAVAAAAARQLSAALHLERAWLGSNDRFSLRLWRQPKHQLQHTYAGGGGAHAGGGAHRGGYHTETAPPSPMPAPPSPTTAAAERWGSSGAAAAAPAAARQGGDAEAEVGMGGGAAAHAAAQRDEAAGGGGRPPAPSQFPPEVLRRALGEAAARGDAPLLSRLLAARGAQPDAHCGLAATPLHAPLHVAVRGGHADVALALLRRGAAVDVLSHGGRSALHLAAIGGHDECARLLLRYGADPRRTDVRGATALDLARAEAQRGCAALLAPLSVAGEPQPQLAGAAFARAASARLAAALPHASLLNSSSWSVTPPDEATARPGEPRLPRSRGALAAELALSL